MCDRSGQGTRRTSGADSNGEAMRPFTPQKKARPSQLTGEVNVGLRTERRRTIGALPIELRRERRRDSNPQPPCLKQKEPPSAHQADSTVKERNRTHISTRSRGTHGESRTRTGRGLSAVPLPVGLREQGTPRPLPGSFPRSACASPARFERATFAFGTRCSVPLSYGELIDWRRRQESNLQPPAS